MMTIRNAIRLTLLTTSTLFVAPGAWAHDLDLVTTDDNGQAAAQGPVQSAEPPASQADAQQTGPNSPSAESIADIVVTGSSIRGVAPTGSALTSVGRADIVASGGTTTTEILRAIPQLNNFGASGNNSGQNQANFVDQPAIHGIGVGNGGAGLTLVLVDGLRLPGAGINQTAPDPSAIPPSAIERVEIVADGASSIYGSDAVAGVVNFILRKNFDGLEGVGRIGFGDGYRTYNASLLGGRSWGTGSIMLDYEYSQNTAVNGRERDYFGMTTPSASCAGNVTVGGTNYALRGNGAVANASNTCDVNKANDLYPAQRRHQGLISFRQELGDSAELHARSLYSDRQLTSLQGAAGGNVTNGAVNVSVTSGPFYNYALGQSVPAGVHSVTYSPVNEIGATIANSIHTKTWSSNIGASTSLFADWKGSIDLNYGRERDTIYQPGLNQTLVAQLVAQGTFNPYGVGPANSPALLSQVSDYRTRYFGEQTVKEALFKFDGSIVRLPGGMVKAAVGADLREEKFFATVDTGPASTAPQNTALGKRKSYSFYGELFVPVVGSDNAMPLLQSLDISASTRYDHYDDVGGTTNPKIGVNWKPADGLLIHGSWGTSFHAPSLADAGTAIDTRVIRFPDFTGTGGAGGYSVILAGGNRLKPETATTWSFGADFKPVFLPGTKLSATYFNIDYKNVITFPGFNPVSEPFNPLYDRYRVYFPTAAQVLAATSGMRHDGVSYPDVAQLPTAIYDLRRQNFARQKIDGLDFDASYAFGAAGGTLDIGTAGTWLWKFRQQINGDTQTSSRLNTNYAVNFKTRGHVSFSNGALDASAFLNYINGYRNTADNRQIDSYTTVDLHVGYKLPIVGFGGATQLTVDVSNLFDRDPPYFYDAANNAYGFDPTVASPLGRVVTLGLRKTF